MPYTLRRLLLTSLPDPLPPVNPDSGLKIDCLFGPDGRRMNGHWRLPDPEQASSEVVRSAGQEGTHFVALHSGEATVVPDFKSFLRSPADVRLELDRSAELPAEIDLS
jgi:hypothetical protein